MLIKKYFIPNFLSLSSIFCGFIAIILANYNEIKFAGFVILLGAVFDGLDGKAARALKVANKMGKEMDSLADLTTFGIATGYLLYQGSLYKYGNLGILAASLIPIFSAIRLARFNVRPTKGYFEGMPTTWVGISIAILQGFYSQLFSPYFYLFFALSVCFLMTSKFRYDKLNRGFLRRLSSRIVILLSFILIFVVDFPIAFLVPIFWYTISGVIFSLLKDNSKKIETYKVKY